MSIELVTVFMFVSMLLLLASGLPIVFCLGSVGIIFAYFLWGPAALGIVTTSMYGMITNFTLIAVPLFIFMAYMLENSGTGENLYDTMHKWLGSIRGGLSIGTIVACALIAAMSGLSATGTISMGVIALPAMLKRKYDKSIAIGSIAAGGALGALIPPSIPMIVYGFLTGVSIGAMFLSGILPGLLLASLFVAYIFIRSSFEPKLCPVLPIQERPTWNEKLASLKMVIIPIVIVIGVLGSIFGGIATPTEAAAVGALLSIISAAVYRQLNWENLKKSSYDTMKITAMLSWIMAAGITFSAVYTALGATKFIGDIISAMHVSTWFIIIGMEITIFLLGMIIDPNSIMMITIPIYYPLVMRLGLDPVWFGLTVIVNLEMSYLTPPFGWNIFYMKSVAPKEITLLDIYRSVWAFVGLQALSLAIILAFPNISTWLPRLAFRSG